MRYRRAVVLVVTLALLIAALWMAATSAQALVVPLSTKQLCDYSQAIVVATVTSMDSEWTGVPGTLSLSKATIMTEVRLRVLEVLKGEPVAGLTVQTPGGRVGDTEVTFTDAPSFVSDQSYVVFLDESLRVVGWREGALPVRDARVAGQSLRTFERRISASGERPPLVLRPRLLAQLRTTASVSRHASANVHASSGPVPVITAITPPAASVGTGAKVVLTGRNFGAKQGAAGRVQFMCGNDERIGAPIVSWSDTRIVCKVPTVRVPSAGGDVVTKSARSGPVVVRNRWSRVSKGLQFSVSFAWGGRTWGASPCTYRINANSKNGAQLGELVKAAIASWNNAGANFAFVPEGTGTCNTTSYILDDNHDDIFWSALIPPGDAVLATLALTNNHAPDGKTTTEFDMWFNDSIDKKWGDGAPGTGSFDVQSVALHELGHVLMLNDLYSPFDEGKVMYGGLDPNMQRRTLSDDDKAGIQWIYGKKGGSASGTIAFVRDGDIWTISAGGANERRLTASSQIESEPAWSPDGRTIAYIRDRPGYGYDTCWNEIWAMNADGSDQRRVPFVLSPDVMPGTTHAETMYSVDALAWAPNGNDIGVAAAAYSSYPTMADGLFALQLYLVHPDGTDQRRLGPLQQGMATYSMSWRPDGAQIALTQGSRFAGHLVMYDVAGSRYSEPYGWQRYMWNAVWNPDGTRLAAVVRDDEDPQQWPGRAGMPAGLPKHVVVMDQRTGGEISIAVPHPYLNSGIRPSWSPDGKYLACSFGSDASWDNPPPPSTVLLSADGSSSSLLTADADAPAWSP